MELQPCFDGIFRWPLERLARTAHAYYIFIHKFACNDGNPWLTVNLRLPETVKLKTDSGMGGRLPDCKTFDYMYNTSMKVTF